MKYIIKKQSFLSEHKFTYEGKTRYDWWTIRTEQPYLEISLKKIGMTDIEAFIKRNPSLRDHKKISVLCHNKDYSWTAGNISMSDWSICTFLGEVEVTPDDIKEWKILKDAEKYNL